MYHSLISPLRQQRRDGVISTIYQSATLHAPHRTPYITSSALLQGKGDTPRIKSNGAGPALGLKSNKSRYGGWPIAPCTSLARRLEACDIRSQRMTGRFLILSSTDRMAAEWEARTGGAMYVGEGRKRGGYALVSTSCHIDYFGGRWVGPGDIRLGDLHLLLLVLRG